jgi:hypothetical protein
VAPFIDERIFRDIQRIFSSKNRGEREAAALTCYESNYEPAQQLLEQHVSLKNEISLGKLSWQSIALKMSGNEAHA